MKHMPYIFAKVKADELGGFIEKKCLWKEFYKKLSDSFNNSPPDNFTNVIKLLVYSLGK